MDIEQLYREYFTHVYKYILSISKNPHTAEEITQETFFKALKKIDTYKGEADIRVWLCQIAKNLYFDHRRKMAKRGELPEGREGESQSAENIYINEEMARAAHFKLHSLKEPYKEVFSLRAFAGLSFEDIGELFGKSSSWARVTYHRARLKIQEELEK